MHFASSQQQSLGLVLIWEWGLLPCWLQGAWVTSERGAELRGPSGAAPSPDFARNEVDVGIVLRCRSSEQTVGGPADPPCGQVGEGPRALASSAPPLPSTTLGCSLPTCEMGAMMPSQEPREALCPGELHYTCCVIRTCQAHSCQNPSKSQEWSWAPVSSAQSHLLCQ